VVQVAQLLGAASALFTTLGCQLDRESQDLFTAYTDAARGTLGAQEFADAWARGQAMTGEEAVELAFAINVPAAPKEQSRSAGGGRKGSFGGLTRREREVAVLVAQGKSNREIAATLVITEHTVEGHMSNLLTKLDFRSRSQISAWAVEHGLTAEPC
jgi:DNA-binding NarL/FixJ family response regulator